MSSSPISHQSVTESSVSLTQGHLDSLEPTSPPSQTPSRRRKTAPPSTGLKAPSDHGKNFVLDTNVLIHDPHCFERFADNHVCIPVEVLSELDRFKNEQSDRGASARIVHRTLTSAFNKHADSITTGVATSGGGSLRLLVADPTHAKSQERLDHFRRILPDSESTDNRIIACTLMVAEANSSPTVLVTKDLNMQLKAKALGLACEDYESDKVNSSELRGSSIGKIEVDPNELQRFASTGELELEPDRIPPTLTVNEYVLLAAGEKRTMPARFGPQRTFLKLQLPDALRNPKGLRLKPMNLGQQCLIDALINPDISLVTCFGPAGTGKTLVGVAAGLHGVFSRSYSGLTISRPVVPMGDSVGFLPGDLEQKMRPWLQPIYDALDYLIPSSNAGATKKNQKDPTSPQGSQSPYQDLIDSKLIEIEALCYIRGRSIPNRFFILDEAQQMTPLEAKTVVTRMSKGAKLVMIGDPDQIDNPYVDSRSNGLVYTRRRLKGIPIAAHITLEKGERSALAEAGAKLM